VSETPKDSHSLMRCSSLLKCEISKTPSLHFPFFALTTPPKVGFIRVSSIIVLVEFKPALISFSQNHSTFPAPKLPS